MKTIPAIQTDRSCKTKSASGSEGRRVNAFAPIANVLFDPDQYRYVLVLYLEELRSRVGSWSALVIQH